MFPDQIYINGVGWDKIKERDYEKVAVYTNGQEFLRLGSKRTIEEECLKQKKLVTKGFPLPNITKTGEYKEYSYFIEPSFGTTLFTFIFADECKKHGTITQKTFEQFLGISLRLTKAQLANPLPSKNQESLEIGVHYKTMLEELSAQKEDLEKAYSKTIENISVLPWTINHGDFTSHNILEQGTIDIGANFEGPVGYDAISAICHIENFPFGDEHEISRGYWFTKEQIDQYMKEMDKLFVTFNLPPLSKYLSDFIFLRTLWTAARMHHLPKLQKWRYDYMNEVLTKYLANEDLSLPHANPPLDNFS